MKTKELREKSVEELNALRSELRTKLWKAKFQNYSNQLDNTSEIKKTKKDVARILTILREQKA